MAPVQAKSARLPTPVQAKDRDREMNSPGPDPVPCRLCDGATEPAFRLTLLHKHDVQYWRCRNCHSLQSDSPTWLQEAYEDAIAGNDTGRRQPQSRHACRDLDQRENHGGQRPRAGFRRRRRNVVPLAAGTAASTHGYMIATPIRSMRALSPCRMKRPGRKAGKCFPRWRCSSIALPPAGTLTKYLISSRPFCLPRPSCMTARARIGGICRRAPDSTFSSIPARR